MNIEFFTDNELALKHYPPILANKMIPTWYENTDTMIKGARIDCKYFSESKSDTPFTIKSCIPVKDYITSGYFIQAFTDVLITPEQTDDGLEAWWAKSMQPKTIDHHPHAQCPIKLGKGKNVYIKYNNPWTIKTPPGYSCMFYQPEYFFNENIKFFPGIVDTDKFDIPVNFPGIVLAKETFTLKAGTPIMAVFPFKRDDWVSKVGFKKLNTSSALRTKLFGAYLKLFHSQKSYK
jgi:hypothetical protein